MDHLRAFIKYHKDKHPEAALPRASDEVYSHLTDAMTPHAMKIMQKDNAVFRGEDAAQPCKGIEFRPLWDGSDEAWKLLHMAMIFSFLQGDPKAKVSQVLEAMKHLVEVRETGGRFTDIFDFLERVDPRSVNKRALE